ncbi:MAG: VWA domain-containing protein [Candidatus Methylacidiphilales bacterium]|nr:VWA domain-containing protein [Candidatus Methylacidiphilales bacterium]
MKLNSFLKVTAGALGLAAMCALGAAFLVPTAARAETLTVRCLPEQKKVPYGKSRELVIKIDIDSEKGKTTRRLPLNIAVVLDRSGSMSGAKIEKARQAACALVDQLGAEDTFSLVAYDNDVDVLIPAQRIEEKAEIKRKIERIRPGGSTALYAGVEEGAKQLKRYFETKNINRVILLSDGLANVGPSSTGEVRDLGRRLSGKGISVSTIGLGDDYNEDLMTALAVASDANYYYVKDVEKLQQVFEKELGELLAVTARNIRIRIVLPNGVEPLGLIGRDEKFDTDKRTGEVTFAPFYSGQQRYIFLRCRLPDNETEETRDVAKVQLSYDDELNAGKRVETEQVVQVSYSKDAEEAAKTVDKSVVIARDLQYNALEKDRAVQYNDSGNYKEANRILKLNEQKLRQLATDAKKDGTVSANEIQKLEAEADQMNEAAAGTAAAPMTPSARKATTEQSYRTKMAK